VGTIVHETMVARCMLAYRHVLVAGRTLVERLGLPESVEALQRFPCAVWSPGAGVAGRWHLGEDVIEPQAVLTTNDYAHLRNRALAGDIVTELPPFLAHDALTRGKLVRVLPSLKLPEVSINLLYPSHRHPSSLVRAYLSYCREHAEHYLQAVYGSDKAKRRGLARS